MTTYRENMKHFDVVVLGAGSAGELISNILTSEGKSVALIEKLRVGGECAFVSCMPSKTMLRSGQARNEAKHLLVLGGVSKELEFDSDFTAFRTAAKRRDHIVKFRNDYEAAAHSIKSGAELFRGNGIFTAADRLQVDANELGWDDLVIATGSQASLPPIAGLEAVDYWTSDLALSIAANPRSVLIVGGGPVGCELAQLFSRFGSETTIVQFSEQLADREESSVAARLTEILRSEGVSVYLNTSVIKVELTPEGMTLAHLSDNSSLIVERLILAAGRHPNTQGFNLEAIGVVPDKKGAIAVDENCRVIGHPHIWAAGDVTGIAPFTHTANYQGRIVANNILGATESANYSAVPRAIYTDPPVASVGKSKSSEEDGLVTSRVEFSGLARNLTDGGIGGLLVLTADLAKGVLVGAAAIGPHADEWMAELTLAIRAQIPLAVLNDVIHAFPTFGSAIEDPIRELVALSKNLCVVRDSNPRPGD